MGQKRNLRAYLAAIAVGAGIFLLSTPVHSQLGKGKKVVLEIQTIGELPLISVEGIGAETAASGGKRIGQAARPNAVVRLASSGKPLLWDWYRRVKDGRPSRKALSVIIKNRSNQEIARYNLYEAWPCRWTLSYVNGALVEEAELAVEWSERDGLSAEKWDKIRRQAVSVSMEIEGIRGVFRPISIEGFGAEAIVSDVREFLHEKKLKTLRSSKTPGRTTHSKVVVRFDPKALLAQGMYAKRYGGKVTLKRHLSDWYKSVLDGTPKKLDCSLILLDRGKEITRYNLLAAWPSSWTLAYIDKMLVEELELTIQRIERR